MSTNDIKDSNSSYNGSNKRTTDSYLESLQFIAKYYQKNVSKESLSSGILVQGSFMGLNDFIKSASRIGLISKTANRKIEQISKLALPCLLVLKNNRASVLLDIDFKTNKAKVFIPGLGGETVVTIDRLLQEYDEKIVLIKNEYQYKSNVHKEVEIEKPKHWFIGSLKRNKDIYKKVVLAAIFINLFVIVVPLFTMNVYDRVLPNNAFETLWVLAFGVLTVMIFDFVLKIIRSSYLGLANKRADIVMSNKIYDQLLNIKINQKPASTGMFLSRLQSFESVRDFFTTATITAIVDLPFVFLFLLVIFFISGPLVWVSIATIFIAISFSWYMQKPIKEIIEKSAKEDQIKLTVMNETVAGLEIIKSVRGESRMKKQFENALNQTVYYNEKSQHLSQIVSYFTAFISQLSSICIVVYGVFLASENELTMGAIIAAMMLNSRVVGPISQVASLIIRYDRTLLSLDNINQIMEMEREKDDKVYLSRPYLNGDIEFKNVTFAYKDQNFDALKEINLTIKQGEKIAIIGKIGSGKSTLAKLIMNIYTPTNGSVMIDKTDVRQIDVVDLRKAVGYVPQEPFLFLGSIKDNITIGSNFASDEDLLEAGKITGLTEFLGKRDAGFDLLVGERGDGLSGGEKQSITLARALISKPNFLILDEPTNAMDLQTEQKFIQNMETSQISKDKTLIIMTHKMSILKLVDRVIILHDGKIIADGPKDKVMKSLVSGAQ